MSGSPCEFSKAKSNVSLPVSGSGSNFNISLFPPLLRLWLPSKKQSFGSGESWSSAFGNGAGLPVSRAYLRLCFQLLAYLRRTQLGSLCRLYPAKNTFQFNHTGTGDFTSDNGPYLYNIRFVKPTFSPLLLVLLGQGPQQSPDR